MNEHKLFISRLGIVGLTNILVAISTLIFLPILTQNLTINEYGLWVQINTIIALIPNLATLGLPFTIVRFLPSETNRKIIQENFYCVFFIVLIFSLISVLSLILLAKPIAELLFEGYVDLVYITSFVILIVCLNTVLMNYFRAFQQMKLYSIFVILQTYISLIIISYVVLMGFGVLQATIGLLITNLVIFLIIIYLIISEIGFIFPKFIKAKKFLSFGVPTIPSNLSYWAVDLVDRVLIGIILGNTFVGIYNPAYTLGNVINFFLAPFSILLPAILPKYYEKKEKEKLTYYLEYSIKMFIFAAIPSVFGLSILSKPILTFLSTPEIASQGYFITPFVAISAFLWGLYGIIVNIIFLEEKTKVIGFMWILAAFVNVIFNILLLPFFGILGAAVATLISYFLVFIITIKYSFKFMKLNLDFVFILKSVFSSTIFSLIILFLYPNGILNVLIMIILSSIIYLGIMILIKGIKMEEIQFMRNILIKD